MTQFETRDKQIDSHEGQQMHPTNPTSLLERAHTRKSTAMPRKSLKRGIGHSCHLLSHMKRVIILFLTFCFCISPGNNFFLHVGKVILQRFLLDTTRGLCAA